jgi:hypothetical protein
MVISICELLHMLVSQKPDLRLRVKIVSSMASDHDGVTPNTATIWSVNNAQSYEKGLDRARAGWG